MVRFPPHFSFIIHIDGYYKNNSKELFISSFNYLPGMAEYIKETLPSDILLPSRIENRRTKDLGSLQTPGKLWFRKTKNEV